MRWILMGVALMMAISTARAEPMRAPEKAVPNLMGCWRADAREGDKLTDLSGQGQHLKMNNLTFTQTETRFGWGVAGRAVASTNGVGASYAEAQDAATWKPLHDGSGVSWWAVIRPQSIATSTLFDTGAGTTSACGGAVRLDVRERLGLEFSNGGANGYLIDNVNGGWYTWNGTVKSGAPHVVVATFNAADTPQIKIWMDGEVLGSLSKGDREKPTPESRPFGNGDPAKPLRLLTAVSGIWPYAGEWAEFGIARGTLADADRKSIEAWAAEHYGIKLVTQKRGILLWDGNSLVDNIWRTDQFPDLVTPALKQPAALGPPARNVMRAIAGLQGQQMIARAPRHVTPVYDKDAPFNIIAMTEVLNSLAEGVSKEITYKELVEYCQARRKEGWRVVIAPPLPAGAGIKRADLDWVKDQIVTNWKSFADGIVRADLDPELGSWGFWEGDKTNKVIRNDTVHFTPAGNKKYAPYWVTAINAVFEDIERNRAAAR